MNKLINQRVPDLTQRQISENYNKLRKRHNEEEEEIITLINNSIMAATQKTFYPKRLMFEENCQFPKRER